MVDELVDSVGAGGGGDGICGDVTAKSTTAPRERERNLYRCLWNFLGLADFGPALDGVSLVRLRLSVDGLIQQTQDHRLKLDNAWRICCKNGARACVPQFCQRINIISKIKMASSPPDAGQLFIG